MNLYSVIMAGGGGTRFWPLSRQTTPKQILNITGKDIMINETIERCKGFIPYENTYIVTNQDQREALDKLVLDGIPKKNILVEPVARNTAPCILLSAMKILKDQGDGIMFVFPADHYIADVEGFRKVLKKAALKAEDTDRLITIGIHPTFPATGYGYINYDYTSSSDGFYEVLQFEEKPGIEKAKSYLNSGNYLWNSGMFVWKVSVIIENFKRYLPRIYEAMVAYQEAIDTDAEWEALCDAYRRIRGISIDYGIMERSNEVLVIPGDFGWSDVGSWDSLGAVIPADDNGNIVRADLLGIDTKDSIIYGQGKLIATIGLNKMIIVQTDDALLICPKERAQDVKEIVDELKRQGRTELI